MIVKFHFGFLGSWYPLDKPANIAAAIFCAAAP
jgi:hypothetical protein